MNHLRKGWSAIDANFGGVGDGFDYAAEQARDEKEMLPVRIKDDCLQLLNDGRIEDAKEIYNWLEGELDNRQAWRQAR